MTGVLDVPERTLRQRLDALEHANRVRSYRARVKRDVKAGRVSAVELLLDPPALLETMQVVELLLAIPKIGRTKVRGILNDVPLSPSKTMVGMTDRQRAALIRRIAGWC